VQLVEVGHVSHGVVVAIGDQLVSDESSHHQLARVLDKPLDPGQIPFRGDVRKSAESLGIRFEDGPSLFQRHAWLPDLDKPHGLTAFAELAAVVRGYAILLVFN